MAKERRFYTLEEKKAAVARYKRGESARDVGAELGIHRGLIMQWAAGRGLGRNKPTFGKKPPSDRRSIMWSEEQKREIASAWAEGQDSHDLAEKYGVPHHTQIHHWARERGIVREAAPPDPLQDEVLRRRRSGESVTSISNDLCLSPSRVYRWLKAAGYDGESEPAPEPGPESGQLFPRMESARVPASSQEPQETTSAAAQTQAVTRYGLPVTVSDRSKRVPKKLVVSYSCPHCAMAVPPPSRPREGELIATQFLCPHCAGTVNL